MSLQNSARQIARSQVLSRGLLRPASVVPVRSLQTQSLSESENLELLNKQRSLRPNSPWHIYQPQLTSVSSIANRVTGSGLSVAMYGVFLGHLLAPALGVPFDSAAIVSFVSDLPGWFKLSVKTAVGAAMSFHTLNGLRHLSWDMGKLLELKTSYAAGYAVLAGTALSTIGLLML